MKKCKSLLEFYKRGTLLFLTEKNLVYLFGSSDVSCDGVIFTSQITWA